YGCRKEREPVGYTIEIVGLGAGDIDQLPLGIYKKLLHSTDPIYVRTMDHPVVDELRAEGVAFYSFDHVYEANDNFADVYATIVDALLDFSAKSSIIYAVPGNPLLAEQTTHMLLEARGDDVKIVGGHSYLDALFTAVEIDPIDGFQFVDATSFNRRQLDYRQHTIVCQVYDRIVASDVKLALLEDLPSDFLVTIVQAAGTKREIKWTIPLEELDRSDVFDNLTSIYIPPASSDLLRHTFSYLREVIRRLRGPGGCPWDQKQTHESLREYAIEEVYELIEAIDVQDIDGMIEELGDLLLQVMLHSQIAADDGYFTIDDVIRSLTDKMIRRHPHVFSDSHVHSAEMAHKNWDKLKKEEKKRDSVLDGVPTGSPSLVQAYELQKKASEVGFDWDDIEDVWNKLDEEIKEVYAAIQT